MGGRGLGGPGRFRSGSRTVHVAGDTPRAAEAREALSGAPVPVPGC
ncbi:MAG: hypothetical protein AVDCRST_MAG41-827 [uncultured Corynebacteriales bacterium]|uniref:Uncharacterized protein n=1 Tax=uncultured Mycobacteriales bacterium TaxID=581187 RepID=A0A6J4HP51_9ACTN|nr:MAG: hypothetical protein AVDCRST_MAG41-827 [uncultured Corynebacteriales bacterium]